MKLKILFANIPKWKVGLQVHFNKVVGFSKNYMREEVGIWVDFAKGRGLFGKKS